MKICAILTLLITLQGPPISNSSANKLEVEHCIVSSLEQIDVAAPRAGLIVTQNGKSGEPVLLDQLLVQIDSREALLREQAARVAYDSAVIKSENDTDIRHARAAFEVASTEYSQAIATNRGGARSVSDLEVRRLKLTRDRAELQIEVAEQEQRIAAKEAEEREQALLVAARDVADRKIISPRNGQVLEVFRRPGEWAQQGEPLLRIMPLDTVRVEGYVSLQDVRPQDILNRTVSIHVPHARKDKPYTGTITYIRPLVESEGEYRVGAEIENPQSEGFWELIPGMSASMTIDLN